MGTNLPNKGTKVAFSIMAIGKKNSYCIQWVEFATLLLDSCISRILQFFHCTMGGGASIWFASALAGVLSRAVVHPIDTLRTIQMTSSMPMSLHGAVLRATSSGGVRGLYRGFGASLTLHAPAISIYLSVYERVRDKLPEELPPVVRHASAGFAAEAASAVVWAPLETIKQRAQLRTSGKNGGSVKVLSDLLKREGPGALLSGYSATLVVFGPYAALYFVVYERCREELRNRNNGNTPGGIATSAAVAGAISAAATTPLDVVKTRLQTQGDSAIGTKEGQVRYRGMVDAAKSIAKTEGLGAFSKGITARMLWMMPGTAITMTAFEALKRIFGDKANRDAAIATEASAEEACGG